MKLVCIAEIIAPHGIKGEVKIKIYSRSPDALVKYGPVFDQSGHHSYDLNIQSVNNNYIIARLAGITDRTNAESLRNTKLYIRRDSLELLSNNEYYIYDLIDMQVVNLEREEIGTVTSVENYGASDIINITFSSGKEQSFAFTKEVFPIVDIKEGIIVFDMPHISFVGKK